MKLRKNLFVTVLLATATLASTAFAADGARVDLHVPFSFVVSGRTLPAGAYQLSEDGSLLYIRGSHNALVVVSTPVSYSVGSKPSLLFRREAGIAYLIGVQMSDESRALPFHPEHNAFMSH